MAHTPCIYEVDIDKIIGIQNPPVMLPTINLKDEVEPGQVPLSLICLLHQVILAAKHNVIGSLHLYVSYQEASSGLSGKMFAF